MGPFNQLVAITIQEMFFWYQQLVRN